MKSAVLKNVFLIGLAFVFVSLLPDSNYSQERKRSSSVRVIPNHHAPELYADKINFRLTLVNLPGANSPESNWQTSYKVYFVPESEFDGALRAVGNREPTPEDFPGKILITSGSVNKKSLQNISGRIVEKNALPFKVKIPDKSKTMFGKIITFYTAKIYDARLKKTAYQTSLFISPPFEPNGAEKKPLENIFLNLYVNNDGRLFTSQMERNKTNADW